MSSPLPIESMHPEWRGFARAITEWLSNRKPEPPILPRLVQAKLRGAQTNIGALVLCTDLPTPAPIWWDGTVWRLLSDNTPI